jgi:hypothetical protein
MKKLNILLAIVLFAAFSFAQEVKKDDWIRVQSDDGEFSIEVPAKYGYFFDKDGTLAGDRGGSYVMNEMCVFNSYTEHTLLSFESYKAGQKALEALEGNDDDAEKYKKSEVKWYESKKDGINFRMLIAKNDKYIVAKRYYYSKNYIYILIVASRLGETQVMKRFFDSIVFNPIDEKVKKLKNERFSSLKATVVEYVGKPKKIEKEMSTSITNPIQSDPTVSPFIVISQPRASYTDEARKNNEQGVISYRIEFSEYGQITKVSELKTLRYGLIRNALIAALQIKYLPKEKDEKPIVDLKVLEYKFALY